MSIARERGRRGGIGALLAGLRLLFNNPLMRLLLRAATSEAVCLYSDRRVRASMIYHALSRYTGEKLLTCPITAEFLAMMISSVISLGIRLLRGREEEVVEALKDPALRRGVALVLKGLGLYGVTVPQKLPAPFMVV